MFTFLKFVFQSIYDKEAINFTVVHNVHDTWTFFSLVKK